MISEKDLIEAIAECQGERNPNANTCIKLASYLTIKKFLYPSEDEEPTQSYSYAMPAVIEEDYYTNSEFSQKVKEIGMDKAYPVIDDLMSTLAYINPKLYDSVMRKLNSL